MFPGVDLEMLYGTVFVDHTVYVKNASTDSGMIEHTFVYGGNIRIAVWAS